MTRTFVLQNVTSNNEANEVITTARVIVAPEVRMFLAPSSNSLVVRGTPEELEQVAKIVSDLDRPKKTYRVTYTITEFDAGKKIGLQHYTLTFADGQRVVLKDGSRVPYSNGMNQFSVHDVGLNLDATLNASPGVIQLKSKVERTSVAEDKVAGNSTSPVTRQAELEGTIVLRLGKPAILGSFDIPESTRHLEVEAVIEGVN